MAISKKGGRQWPLTAMVEFDFEDAVSGVLTEVVDLPGNAVVVGGAAVIVNAWDSATSAVLTVGDSTDPDRYAAGINAKAAAGTALVPAGPAFVTKDALTVTVTNTGTPTVGNGYVVVQYIIVDRANEVQPA